MSKMYDLPCRRCIYGLNCEYTVRLKEMVPYIDDILNHNNDSSYFPFTISVKCNRYVNMNESKLVAGDTTYNHK